ncbi:unnamed protein product, partial [marine sediment metagenome]
TRKGREMSEPKIAGNDLQEWLKTTRARCEIALLLIDAKRNDLLPTILEDLFYGTQIILDCYCIEEI